MEAGLTNNESNFIMAQLHDSCNKENTARLREGGLSNAMRLQPEALPVRPVPARR